jgi:hypothetical protein
MPNRIGCAIACRVMKSISTVKATACGAPPGPPETEGAITPTSSRRRTATMSRARINDDEFVLDNNAFEAAVLRDDAHNCFGKIIEDRRAGAPRSDRGTGPGMGFSFTGTMLLLLGGGPALGWALRWAGPVLSARLLLRRSLSGQVRGNSHLLGRGQTAAARVRGRPCNQGAFSHVGRSFGAELPDG